MKTRDDDRVDAYLARLPAERPDAGHCEHVVDLHVRRRRWRRMVAPALAASVMLAGVLLQSRGPAIEPDPPAGVAPTEAWVELRSVDRRLQVAYRDGATDEQLAQLWASRRDAERLVIDASDSSRRVRL